MDTHDRELRYDALAGLQELLIELAAHTNLPVPKVITVDVHAENDLIGFEVVGRASAHLGVTVHTAPNGTQRAVRQFGPVTYAVVYTPQHPKEI